MPFSPESRWELRRAPPGAEEALRRDGRFGGLTCRLLAARGYQRAEEAAAFLEAPLAGLHPPGLLLGMGAAVERLAAARRRQERVAVYGDYDVDGVTSAVLLAKLFRLLELPHEVYIPDRVREGYGLNADALRELKRRGCAAVVTVDCGVSAVPEAILARELGLDLIVTDHHVPGERLPEALALVNPKTSPAYPYPMLGGVGVAWKLAQSLLAELQHPRAEDFLDHMLELVALGTVCDVAPLDGENRALVKAGLSRLRQGRWLGLRCLAEAAELSLSAAKVSDIGFKLGPRLNAGGRVGDAMLGVRLLLSKESSEARALAAALEQANAQRQALEREAVESAAAAAAPAAEAGAAGLVVWNPAWHPGVVGLCASRLLERYRRPVFVFAVEGEKARGSGRSRAPFHLVRALEACAAHLQHFGGHEAAAGASARAADLPAFGEAFAAEAARLAPAQAATTLADLEIGLGDIEDAWAADLAAFEPCGQQNPRPLFLARGLRLGPGCRAVGRDSSHLKLSLVGGGRRLEGIAFGQAQALPQLSAARSLRALFHLGVNSYGGRSSLQAEVKSMQAEEAA